MPNSVPRGKKKTPGIILNNKKIKNKKVLG
jgi:hypothetical protein